MSAHHLVHVQFLMWRDIVCLVNVSLGKQLVPKQSGAHHFLCVGRLSTVFLNSSNVDKIRHIPESEP